MADKPADKTAKTKKKQPKRPELTARQRSEQAPVEKRRILQRTAKGASTPFRLFGRGVAKVLRPFKFLLWPFTTRPARFIGRMLAAVFFFRYFRNSWKELKLVTWPDRKQTMQLTFAVFVFAFVFGVMITLTDMGLERIFKQLLL